MSEFKRKSQTSGFEAGEESFEAVERVDASAPDFSALEAESGFSAGQAEETIEEVIDSPTPIDQISELGIDRAEQSLPEPTPAQPADEEPAKKRYYSPGEVMKKKGCIGCGGMALAIPVMLAVVALVIALF